MGMDETTCLKVLLREADKGITALDLNAKARGQRRQSDSTQDPIKSGWSAQKIPGICADAETFRWPQPM